MPPVRHSSVTTIAPTGTISRLADCSSGIEPHFALAWWSNVLWKDHQGATSRFLDAPGPVRKALEGTVGGEDAEILLRRLADEPGWRREPLGSILDQRGIRTAMEITPDWHVRMQAAWQESVTNSVSKTINLPNSATVEDVSHALWQAWETGCKAITIYRDGSKSMQVLETGGTSQGRNGEQLEAAEGVRPIPRDRPAVVSGVTERVRTGHGNMYVTINVDEGGSPFEVFSTLGKGGGCDAAYLEAISRLTSLALRSGIDAAQVIDQLRGITCDVTWDQGVPVRSPADAVALALLRRTGDQDQGQQLLEPVAAQSRLFAEGSEVSALAAQPIAQRMGPRGNQCPECYSTLAFEEGCMKCYACGYSKC